FAALLADASIAGVLDGADGLRFLGLPAWRWMFLAGALPALGYGVIALLVPESPRYLAARGRLEAASAVLARLQSLPADQADRE
ncbi:MFS transporter, partial [Escherichia coli]|uniref:MFS transporter n=1 Tax=Escherichia coli TaxID=562 RepID=UPI001D0A91B1